MSKINYMNFVFSTQLHCLITSEKELWTILANEDDWGLCSRFLMSDKILCSSYFLKPLYVDQEITGFAQ